MPRAEFRTTQCRRHGHAEFTLVIEQKLPVPALEKILVSYFEDQVARGTTFKVGETVQFGWAMLRIGQRSDGTLSVAELAAETESGWRESVGTALMDTWFQQQVAVSLSLEPEFPRQGQTAYICGNVEPGLGEYMLSRGEPVRANDSGWFIGCCEDDHDHNTVDNLSLEGLLGVILQIPILMQFVALPFDTNLHIVVSKSGAPIPTIYIDGEPRTPKRGSYLASLIKKRG
jgi:hypothetical protein